MDAMKSNVRVKNENKSSIAHSIMYGREMILRFFFLVAFMAYTQSQLEDLISKVPIEIQCPGSGIKSASTDSSMGEI